MASKSRGVVLIVSLVFLIALTAVAGALMQNTTSDMKMSDASQIKVIATQEAISSIDEVVYNEINTPGIANGFARPMSEYPRPSVVSADDTTAQISVATPNNLVVDCPHSKTASSVQVFKCNALRVQINRLYGRDNLSRVQVTSGIAQQLLP